MAGLPKSIIAKYGVTKKAWQVFRGTKNSKKTVKRRSSNMARRRRKGGFRSKGSGSISVVEMGIGSAAYGYMRPTIANVVPDIPGVPFSDNVVLGGIGALAAWKGKGLIKKAGMVVLANEAFIASSRMAAGQSSNNNGEY